MSTKPDDLYKWTPTEPGWQSLVPASTADVLDWLIAEGGETIWWCEEHDFGQGYQYDPDICPGGYHGESCRMVKRLVYGPIPVESAEAKETP